MIDLLLEHFRPFRAPAEERAIRAAEEATGFRLVKDHRRFLLTTDGWEGLVGENYFALYSVEELVQANAGYEVQTTRPELLLFGTDRGGEGFFLDMSTPGPAVIMIAFVSDWTEDAVACGDTFVEFLHQLVHGPTFS